MPKISRYIIISLCFMFVAAQCLPAQDASAEVFGGYSYAKANPLVTLPKQNMNGWVGSAAGYANRWFGAGLEVAGQFGTLPPPSGITAPNLTFKEYSYLAGPQFRFVKTGKVQAAAKLLLGGVFGQVNLDKQTSAAASAQLSAAGYIGFNQTKFAMLVAVPVDVGLTKLIGIRVEPGLYLTDFSKTKQSNFRLSVGPVFRFGGK
ncbi:MAG: hypothetical protein NTW28_01120 [Candidatus Solibacter sp.]|nr:hypothetical protein [Candidatus Solibacter sp.]